MTLPDITVASRQRSFLPDLSFEARLGVGGSVPGFRYASPGVTKTGAAPDGALEDYCAVSYPRCRHGLAKDLENHRVVSCQIKD